MDGLARTCSTQTLLFCRNGAFLRVTEDEVQGIIINPDEDQDDAYSK